MIRSLRRAHLVWAWFLLVGALLVLVVSVVARPGPPAAARPILPPGAPQ